MTWLAAGAFVLRPFAPGDAPAFAGAVRESAGSIGRWMDWASFDYDVDRALAWFATCDQQRVTGTAHEFGIFDTVTGMLVGGAGLNQLVPHHGLANLGYWVRTSRRGEGAATNAARALAAHGLGPLALSRLEIVVAEGNEDSCRVARRVGAVHECLARDRLRVHGTPVRAHVFSLVR
jgi:RimJ/RimL family protein N-acetyltransferase